MREVPDLQTAWLLLLYCAVPRANHLLRAIPPDLVAEYARAHDDGIWETFLDLIGYQRNRTASAQLSSDRAQSGEVEGGNGEGAAMYQRDFASETRALRDITSAGATDPHRDSRSCCPAPAPAGPRAGSVESGALPASNESGEVLGTEVGGGDGSAAARGSIAANLGPDPVEAAARKIAFLPLVHGGFGLRSSSLLAPAAHWAAWADALPIIAERAPELGDRVLQELEAAESSVPCIRSAVAAERAVTQPEFRCKPTWQELLDGTRPPQRPQQYDDEPGQ